MTVSKKNTACSTQDTILNTRYTRCDTYMQNQRWNVQYVDLAAFAPCLCTRTSSSRRAWLHRYKMYHIQGTNTNAQDIQGTRDTVQGTRHEYNVQCTMHNVYNVHHACTRAKTLMSMLPILSASLSSNTFLTPCVNGSINDKRCKIQHTQGTRYEVQGARYKVQRARATIEVYLFLAKTFSEWRGSLTQNRRKKNAIFFPHDSRRAPRGYRIFPSGIIAVFFFLSFDQFLG